MLALVVQTEILLDFGSVQLRVIWSESTLDTMKDHLMDKWMDYLLGSMTERMKGDLLG